jgi:hypothetical protein
MRVKMLGMLTAAGAALTFAAGGAAAAAGTPARTGYEPVLNSGDFVRVINNPYYRSRLGGRWSTRASGMQLPRPTGST